MNKLCFFDRKRKFIRAFRSRAHEPAGFLVLSSTNKKHRQSGAIWWPVCMKHAPRTPIFFRVPEKFCKAKVFWEMEQPAFQAQFLLKDKNLQTAQSCDMVVELKAAKTHTVLYQINRTEYYCQVDLPLSDYPLYGKQLVASRG